MISRAILTLPLMTLFTISHAMAGSHGSGHGGGGQGHGMYYHSGNSFSSGMIYGAGVGYFAPVFMTAPVAYPSFGGPYIPYGGYYPTIVDRGGLLAGPMPAIAPASLGPPPGARRPKRADPARGTQLVTLGDRLFKAGNTRRAEDRYDQAVRADPNAAAPRVRLAQLAFVRGQYTEAANQLREAQTAQPGWLVNAPDVQALFAEPGDFAKQIAKLETHLQANPNDRDAWLTLGAEWFLSGRTRQASDVFLRLSDRQPDETLAAFLNASTPRAAPPN